MQGATKVYATERGSSGQPRMNEERAKSQKLTPRMWKTRRGETVSDDSKRWSCTETSVGNSGWPQRASRHLHNTVYKYSTVTHHGSSSESQAQKVLSSARRRRAARARLERITTLRSWRKVVKAHPASSPLRTAAACAMRFKMRMAPSSQHPVGSATIGKNRIPCCWQVCAVARYAALCCAYAAAAAPGVVLAMAKVSCRV